MARSLRHHYGHRVSHHFVVPYTPYRVAGGPQRSVGVKNVSPSGSSFFTFVSIHLGEDGRGTGVHFLHQTRLRQHTECPPNYAMRGVDKDNNRFLCGYIGDLAKGYGPIGGVFPDGDSYPGDDGTQTDFGNGVLGHECPIGAAMIGWNEGKNQLFFEWLFGNSNSNTWNVEQSYASPAVVDSILIIPLILRWHRTFVRRGVGLPASGRTA